MALTILALVTNGCSFLVPNQNLTLGQKAELVRSSAQAASYFAAKSVYKDDVRRLQKSKDIRSLIGNNIEPVLANDNLALDAASEQALFSVLPPEYSLLISTAMTVLRTYYTTPTVKQTLTLEQLTLLRAFVDGLDNGLLITIYELEN
jgi:hypothetical protein